jgi:hypothetical protein
MTSDPYKFRLKKGEIQVLFHDFILEQSDGILNSKFGINKQNCLNFEILGLKGASPNDWGKTHGFQMKYC